MNNKRLQEVSINKTQLENIKGGYKYVPNGAEAASFVGSSVDIRLSSGKNNVFRNSNTNTVNMNLSYGLR